MTTLEFKIGLVGFNQDTAQVFKESGLSIASHIYANEKHKKKNTEKNSNHMNFHHWKSYNFSEEYKEHAPLNKIASAKKQYMDEFIRCTDRWPWSAELASNWNDYDHLFKLACDHSYGWLKKHEVSCLIYSNVPHQGLAIAQYAMAKELGIKTLIFIQSPFPGKSWIVEDWSDLGKFKTSKPSEGFTLDISAPIAPPFYMASVKGTIKRKVRNILQRARAAGVIMLGQINLNTDQKRKAFQRNTRRWQNAIEDSRYLKQSIKFFANPPLDEKYVYFPLHLQPEMTTDILGGEYADQVFTLEKLRKVIPIEIAIYVKENPKQTGKFRSESFFKRLINIPNLRFISSSTSSFDLIKGSIAVSTITGTAGWEALRMEKPVVVFGNVFWHNLPGVFHISDQVEWTEIKNFKYNANKLQKAANSISCYAHSGICDIDYSVQMEDFNSTVNANKLAKSLKYYLKS